MTLIIVVIVLIIAGVVVAAEWHADPESIEEEERERVEEGKPPMA